MMEDYLEYLEEIMSQEFVDELQEGVINEN
jgi:hypothetical protein